MNCVYKDKDNSYMYQVPAVTMQLELEPSFQSRFKFDPVARDEGGFGHHGCPDSRNLGVSYCAQLVLFLFRRILA